MSELADAAEETCRELLGVSQAVAEIPLVSPYKRRQQCSIRVNIGGRNVIATHRRRPRLARIETMVLESLGAAHAPVPELIASDGNWLIQQDAGRSLTLELNGSRGDETLIDAAMTGVIACQNAGRNAALADHIKLHLYQHHKLLRTVPRLGKVLDMPAPDVSGWAEVLAPRSSLRQFIKWDTRLGNAMIGDDGDIVWIDWEECGLGDPVRDLVKILCDDWAPDRPDMEERLIEKHLLPLADDGEAQTILALYGTLISITRINQILLLKNNGPWWDRQACLEHDLIAVTPETAGLHIRRGARWARRSPLSENLAPWLESLHGVQDFAA